jgi:hypothetical protein
MRLEDVLHWLRATPFVPIRFTMNSGYTFEVRHPELIRLLRTSMIYFTPSEHEDVFDGAQMFGLVLIERIEPIDRVTSNGEMSGS